MKTEAKKVPFLCTMPSRTDLYLKEVSLVETSLVDFHYGHYADFRILDGNLAIVNIH